MISKEAGHLLNKLHQLKNNQNQQNKKAKNMAKSIIQYESKINKWLLQFDFRISQLQSEIKTARESERKQQEQTIKEIDHFQLSLKNLLDSYSKQSKNANQKLNSMVESIKEEMKDSLKLTIQTQKQSIDQYKIVSEKLEKLIELIRSKQKSSIDSFQKLKELIRNKENQVQQINQLFIIQISSQCKKILSYLNQLQDKNNRQLQKIIIQHDKKIVQTNKAINLMVKQAACT